MPSIAGRAWLCARVGWKDALNRRAGLDLRSGGLGCALGQAWFWRSGGLGCARVGLVQEPLAEVRPGRRFSTVTLAVPAPFFGTYTSWLETRSFVSVLFTSPDSSA